MSRLALRFAHLLIFLFTNVAMFVSAGSTSAEDVVLIEEYWELHVGGPNAERSAPQVTMVMSPTATLECDFFLVTLNHWSAPNFGPGGIQVQRWHGEERVDAANGESVAPLEADDEVISWVQRLTLDGSNLKFEVVDGSSHSWGSFGNNGELALSTSTNLAQLNSYLPAVSLGQSGISYAGNRVSSLVLTRLRWVTADGEEHELVAPIDIATDLDP